jgi:methanogenic corrinoid protein MtbC1
MTQSDLHAVARRYVEMLLRAERRDAVELILRLADDAPLESIYLDVLQEAQYDVGRRWERGEISIAQEHYCTAVTQLVMSLLYPRLAETPKSGGTFIGACVAGELHEIGIRFICDFFELRGWRSIYLGSSVPAADMIAEVERCRADVVGISAIRDENVDAVRSLVRELRASIPRAPIVLVGGRPFNDQSELWREVGADGSAADAAESIEAARRLLDDAGRTT